MRATGYPLLAGAHLPVIPPQTFTRLLDSNPLRAGCVQQAIHTGGCHVRSVVTHTDRSTPERDHDELPQGDRQRAPSLSARTALHARPRTEMAREACKAQRERCLLVA